ncbi:MAG: oligosaccharide flippase family protein [Tepidisphaeraceae bacterium]
MAKHHPFTFGRLKRDAATLLVGQVVYRGSGIIVLGVVARLLPAADLGAFFFAEAIAAMLLVVSGFGMNPLLMRRAAAQPDRAGDPLAALLGYRLLAAPVYLAAACGVAYLAGGVSSWLALTLAAAAMLEDLSFSFGALFFARKRIGWNVAIGVVVQVVFVAMLLVGLRWRPSLETWAVVTLLRSLMLAGAYGVVAGAAFVPIRVRWDGPFVMAGLPFILISVLTIARDRADTFLLGLLAAPASVAGYQLAWRVIAATLFVPITVGTTLYPDLAASGADPHNRRRFGRALVGLTVVGLLGTLLLILLASPLCRLLYGPQAPAVVPLLKAAAVLVPMLFVEGLIATSLQAMHRERAVVRFMLIGLAAGVATNVALVPTIGAIGAVVSQLIASAVRLSMAVVALRGTGLFRGAVGAITSPTCAPAVEGIEHAAV